MKIRLSELLDGVEYELINLNKKYLSNTIDTMDICIDSRKIQKNQIFLPILGERVDGHKFIDECFSKDIEFSFCKKNYYYINKANLEKNNYKLILVDNTVKALQIMAKNIIEQFNIKTIAITGSVGKTSTKDYVYEAIKDYLNVYKSKGNYNNLIGLPLTILSMDKIYDYVVLEMGMDMIDEIWNLSYIAKPHIAIITNIGLSHIEKLKSRENIFLAKMEIVSFLTKDDFLIVNGNDDYLSELDYNENGFSVIKAFSDSYKIDSISQIDNKYSYNIEFNKEKMDNKSYEVKLNALGKQHIYNSAIALIVSDLLNCDINKSIENVSKFTGSEKRLEKIEVNNSIILNDCYNSSLESLGFALEVLNNYNKRKIAVIGDILEIGEFKNNIYKDIASIINDLNIDILYTYGADSELIIKNLENLSYKNKMKHFNYKEKLILELNNIFNNSVCLIKGSNGMNMNEITRKLMERV